MGLKNWLVAWKLRKEIDKIKKKTQIEEFIDQELAEQFKDYTQELREMEKRNKILEMKRRTLALKQAQKRTEEHLEDLIDDDEEDEEDDDEEDEEDDGIDSGIENFIMDMLKKRIALSQTGGTPLPDNLKEIAKNGIDNLTTEQIQALAAKFLAK